MAKKWRDDAVYGALIFFCAILLGWLLISSSAAEANVVRVLLTRLNLTDQMTVSLDGHYSIGSLTFQRGAQIKLSCASGQIILYYEGMAQNLSDEAVLIRHTGTDERENGLRVNGDYSLYCGDMHITVQDGQLSAVLYIPVEEYLLGVVPYEMNDSFPLEALKTQAVAARTYAMRRIGANGRYDLVDNTNDQVYKGYQKENINAAKAVLETAGICGFDKNAFANCYYTASNGGQVEVPEHVWGKADGNDYITMHADPYDVENPESVVRKAEIAKAPINGIVGNDALTEAIKLQLTEQLAAMGYTGETEDIIITAVNGVEMREPVSNDGTLVMKKMRLSLSVKARRIASQAMMEDEEMSIFMTEKPAQTPRPAVTVGPWIQVEDALLVDIPYFSCAEPLLNLSINGTNNEIVTVEESDKAFTIAARRYGHGVGMSQRGAQCMAANYSWTYEQILRFYYPGMELRKINTTAVLPSPIAADYLTTPGPAATPTPRPTLMPVTETVKTGEWRVKVTQIGVNSSLNLRSAPSVEAEVIRLLYYGQELIVMERVDEDWLRVRTDVMEGYVMEKFCEKIQ